MRLPEQGCVDRGVVNTHRPRLPSSGGRRGRTGREVRVTGPPLVIGPMSAFAARCSSRGPRRLRPAFPVPTASLRWPSTHSHAVTEQPPRGREAQDSPDLPGHSWSPTPWRASTPQPRVNPSAHPTSVAPATSRTYRLIVGACGRCGCVTEFRPGPRGDFGSNTGSLQHPVIVTSGKQHATTDLRAYEMIARFWLELRNDLGGGAGADPGPSPVRCRPDPSRPPAQTLSRCGDAVIPPPR